VGPRPAAAPHRSKNVAHAKPWHCGDRCGGGGGARVAAAPLLRHCTPHPFPSAHRCTASPFPSSCCPVEQGSGAVRVRGPPLRSRGEAAHLVPGARQVLRPRWLRRSLRQGNPGAAQVRQQRLRRRQCRAGLHGLPRPPLVQQPRLPPPPRLQLVLPHLQRRSSRRPRISPGSGCATTFAARQDDTIVACNPLPEHTICRLPLLLRKAGGFAASANAPTCQSADVAAAATLAAMRIAISRSEATKTSSASAHPRSAPAVAVATVTSRSCTAAPRRDETDAQPSARFYSAHFCGYAD